MTTTLVTAILPFIVKLLGSWVEARYKANKLREETRVSFLKFIAEVEKDLKDGAALRDSTKDQINDLNNPGGQA
jgi:hypothetical protein